MLSIGALLYAFLICPRPDFKYQFSSYSGRANFFVAFSGDWMSISILSRFSVDCFVGAMTRPGARWPPPVHGPGTPEFASGQQRDETRFLTSCRTLIRACG